jgi:hypothetical protein
VPPSPEQERRKPQAIITSVKEEKEEIVFRVRFIGDPPGDTYCNTFKENIVIEEKTL